MKPLKASHKPPMHKVPGTATIKREYGIKDLSQLEMVHLLDLKAREEKLLQDVHNLKLLPDKGQRVREVYDRVLKELERRDSLAQTAALFSQLNLADKGTKFVNNLEWTVSLEAATASAADKVLDSDDDEDLDPLRMIASAGLHKDKVVKVLAADKSLITKEDLDDIESFATDESVVDAEIVTIDVTEKLEKLKPKLQQIYTNHSSTASEAGSSASTSHSQPLDAHVTYLVDKTETSPAPKPEKFKPYKTTLSNVHAPEKERARKLGKHWENTAATPPAIQHNGTKMLTLLDSVEIQRDYLERIKKLQAQQAADRLAARIERLEQRKLTLPELDALQNNPSFTAYRNPLEIFEGHPRFNELDEVEDHEGEGRDGLVAVNVVNVVEEKKM